LIATGNKIGNNLKIHMLRFLNRIGKDTKKGYRELNSKDYKNINWS